MNLKANLKSCLFAAASMLAWQGTSHAQWSDLAVGPCPYPDPYCASEYSWNNEVWVDFGATTTIAGRRKYTRDFVPFVGAEALKSHPFNIIHSSVEGHCLEITARPGANPTDVRLWVKKDGAWVNLSDDEGGNYMPRARVWIKGTTTAVTRNLMLTPYSSAYENDEVALSYRRGVVSETECTTGSGVPGLPWVKFINNNSPVLGNAP